MRYAALLDLTGRLLMTFGLAQLIPAFAAVLYTDADAAIVFLASGAGAAFLGFGIYISLKGLQRQQSKNNLVFLPLLAWVLLPLMAVPPFMLLGGGAGFGASYFESVSAFTTTAFTVLEHGGSLSDSLVFYRSFIAWLGGLFYVVLTLTAYHHLNLGGLQLFRDSLPANEGARLEDEISNSALDIAPVYAGLTFLCFILLSLTGATGHKAALYAMGTMATAGFAEDGQAVFDIRLQEAVLALFMLAGAFNMVFFWRIVHARPVRGSGFQELWRFLQIVLAAGLLLALVRLAADWPNSIGGILSRGFESIFAAISALTTTGYLLPGWSGGELAYWSGLVLMTLALIGGTVGSTAGGAKVLRVRVLFRHVKRELHQLMQPHRSEPHKYDGTTVSRDDMGALWLFTFLSLLGVVASTLIFSALRIPFADALALSVFSVTNAGPLLGAVGTEITDLAGLETVPLGFITFLMIMGRMEAVLIVAMFTRAFWQR